LREARETIRTHESCSGITRARNRARAQAAGDWDVDDFREEPKKLGTKPNSIKVFADKYRYESIVDHQIDAFKYMQAIPQSSAKITGIYKQETVAPVEPPKPAVKHGCDLRPKKRSIKL
jgi:hypothetical protein